MYYLRFYYSRDEAIFCQGLCQGWLHRKCAGLANTFFQKLKENLCVFCQLFEQVSLIDELKEDIRVLKTKLPEVPPCSVNIDQVSLERGCTDQNVGSLIRFSE